MTEEFQILDPEFYKVIPTEDAEGRPLCINCGHTLVCCDGKCPGADMEHICEAKKWPDDFRGFGIVVKW